MDRYLYQPVIEDLEEKMVFLSGPRQVGKTTLALQVLESLSPNTPVYLNWDRPEHRRSIRDLDWSRTGPVAVLDEIHKYHRWKTLIKGFFDTEGHAQRLLVTGSGKLDFYRKGGDSLAGRYRGFRLHPLSIGEIARDGRSPDVKVIEAPASWPDRKAAPGNLLDSLMVLGGFPETFLRGSSRQARRWRLARREHILRQDLRDLSRIREVSLVEHLVDLLAERVTAPLSINSLREDLQVDHKTISAWIEALERLQMVFRVRPYAGSLARALRKEYKVYFWDWMEAPDGGPRFENLVASHLLKLCHWMQDTEGRRVELRYVRDREKREVDFLLLKERKPWILIEAKSGAGPADRALGYFQKRLGVPHAFQVTASARESQDVVPAVKLLKALP
jgi:predicted AAA+ superfamily ATPase